MDSSSHEAIFEAALALPYEARVLLQEQLSDSLENEIDSDASLEHMARELTKHFHRAKQIALARAMRFNNE